MADIYDPIYLQTSFLHPEIETTWCRDPVNDDDIKYLLATPAREAAADLIKQLRNFIRIIEDDPVHSLLFKEECNQANKLLNFKVD